MRRTVVVLLVSFSFACSSASEAPTPPPPAVAPPPPEATGAELEAMEDVVHAHLDGIGACAASANEPALGGEVHVNWRVAADGTVSDVALDSSTLSTPTAPDGGEPARAAERCILAEVATWTYPTIEGSHAVTVHHTFALTPAAAAPTAEATSEGPRVPRVRAAQPTVSAGLSPDVVRRVVRRHVNEIRFCYEQQVAVAPELAGDLTVHYTIDATGAVVAGSPAITATTLTAGTVTDGGPPARAAETCILGAFARWVFPAPDGAATVSVEHPITLTTEPPASPPAPSGEPPPPGTIGIGSGYGVGS